MRVISNKALVDFAAIHADASVPLQMWRRTIEGSFFTNFADVKKAFNATDKVGSFYVFDIGGNKYRLIAAIHFNTQKLYVREVMTHKEYNKWKP
ncbi:type II toxin-antitoxin system HigB family toxin [Burkholderia sp. 22313]|uniref:type II toxin-antitoxin system HigB family toxin n=1 Tax=Burkholderia sp. 22313 TaxID=3453908 RepID=UPI003F8641AD